MASSYIGRFAPSPTGDLHFGSLLSALASFCDARAHNGQWLVRIEDIDPPREVPGAKANIVAALEQYGFYWDRAVSYQSQRLAHYQHYLEQLNHRSHVYPCNCTRQRLRSLNGVYDGFCLKNSDVSMTEPHALRVECRCEVEWQDLVYGHQKPPMNGDFIVKRKDGLFAYQLAVSVDDMLQGITHVVRGYDLLPTTANQMHLMNCWDHTPPTYMHVPMVVDHHGHKLSKQTHAPSLSNEPHAIAQNLWLSLKLLGQNPPAKIQQSDTKTIIQWAIHHWQRSAIPKVAEQVIPAP